MRACMYVSERGGGGGGGGGVGSVVGMNYKLLLITNFNF